MALTSAANGTINKKKHKRVKKYLTTYRYKSFIGRKVDKKAE
jgi:hypothetical protein